MTDETYACSWTFRVGNFDPDEFDYERSARVAEQYLRGSHNLLGPAVFTSATPVPGSFKPSTQGLTDLIFTAPCSKPWTPTFREANDPGVPW